MILSVKLRIKKKTTIKYSYLRDVEAKAHRFADTKTISRRERMIEIVINNNIYDAAAAVCTKDIRKFKIHYPTIQMLYAIKLMYCGYIT